MARPRRSTSAQLAQERITVYLSAEEKEKLEQMKGELSLSEYLLRSGLRQSRPVPVPQINRQAYLELGRIGQNLNQIARACNQLARNRQSFRVQEQWFSELKTQLRQVQWQLLNPQMRSDDLEEVSPESPP